jgi:hypothetical protein
MKAKRACETPASPKPEPCRLLAGVATRVPLLINQEAMQQPVDHAPVGDDAGAGA